MRLIPSLALLLAALAACSPAGADEPLPVPTIVEGSVLPVDAMMAVYVRPSELAKSASARPVVDAFDVMFKPLKLGISVADVEEFKLIFLGDGPGEGPEGVVMVMRAKAAFDWKPMFDAQGKWTAEEFDGRVIARNGRATVWSPDARTMVFVESSNDELISRSMESPDPNDTAPWSKLWDEAARRPLAGMISLEMLGEGSREQGDPLGVLSTDGKFAVASGYFTIGGFQVEGTVTTDSAEAAARVAPATSLTLADFAEMIVGEMPLEDAEKAELGETLTALLAKARVATDGANVRAEGLFTDSMIEVISRMARKAAGE